MIVGLGGVGAEVVVGGGGVDVVVGGGVDVVVGGGVVVEVVEDVDDEVLEDELLDEELLDEELLELVELEVLLVDDEVDVEVGSRVVVGCGAGAWVVVIGGGASLGRSVCGR